MLAGVRILFLPLEKSFEPGFDPVGAFEEAILFLSLRGNKKVN